MNEHPTPLWWRAIRAAGRFAVAIAVIGYTLLDELLFPLFRPLIAWLTRLELFQRLGRWLGRLPPYVALVTLGVPFLLIEPAKVLAIWWVGTGHVVSGTFALLLAQMLSLLVCERIFHAAYGPLMQIGWLKALLGWLFRLRDRAIALAKSAALWQAAASLASRVRAWWRSVLG